MRRRSRGREGMRRCMLKRCRNEEEGGGREGGREGEQA